MLAAVERGQADIAAVSEPLIRQGISKGLWREPFYGAPAGIGPYLYTSLSVNGRNLREEPEVVVAVLRGLIRGFQALYAGGVEGAMAVAQGEFPTMDRRTCGQHSRAHSRTSYGRSTGRWRHRARQRSTRWSTSASWQAPSRRAFPTRRWWTPHQWSGRTRRSGASTPPGGGRVGRYASRGRAPAQPWALRSNSTPSGPRCFTSK